jgi:hypothetical protein
MRIFPILAAAALACGAAPAFAGSIPMDTPVTVNGITTVCTGIGEDAQQDPRWKAYPIRVEFSNGGAQYLAGATVTLKDAKGKVLSVVDCDGAWVLFQLVPGDYSASATLNGMANVPAASGRFSPPAKGQKRVVLTFKGVPANE